MNGYYNRIEETNAVLRYHDDGILWMHSGDFGYIDENGCVFLDGRMKRIIIQYNGMKINPFEIEKVLLNINDVSECCVVGTPDKGHGRGSIPVAFIVSRNNSHSLVDLENRLRSACETELQERYRPTRYFFIDSIPLTLNGKVDYRTLEEKAKKEQ